ncbi:MAG TPA: glutathione S-transferase family protein, partial [Polyangiales bacterium]
MSELILHHYQSSPFAEKMRAIFGYKRLSWRSVDIPFALPKPELVALTGGYRKTPVLQLGCDIYCDTWLIARVVEQLAPERPLFNTSWGATSTAAARWYDRELFMAAISQLFDRSVAAFSAEALGGAAAAAAFAEDRARMMGNTPVRPPRSTDGRVVVEQTLRQLEAQLGQSGPFLEGSEVSWVDFCAYHPLWAMRRNRGLAARLDSYPAVLAWFERVQGFGHGDPTPLNAE